MWMHTQVETAIRINYACLFIEENVTKATQRDTIPEGKHCMEKVHFQGPHMWTSPRILAGESRQLKATHLKSVEVRKHCIR